MNSSRKFFFVLFLCAGIVFVSSQSYEDKRCKCVCPSLAVLTNTTSSHSGRKLYIANVPPSKCNCDGVILTEVGEEIKGREQEYCPRCECKYESRNTTIIKVVVILVIFVTMILIVYMGFLLLLDPLISKRVKASYLEHTNEEEEMSVSPGGSEQVPGPRGNVLNCVTQHQDKWQRQVREQRRNIYDRHTMLN